MRRLKYFMSGVLIAAIIITSAAIPSLGQTIKETKTYYRLDTGVIFAWKNSKGSWQNNVKPDSTYSYSAKLNIGKGCTNVKAYKYDGSNFDFDNSAYIWNKTNSASDKSTYNSAYNNKAANLSNVKGTYSSSSGDIVLSASAKLTGGYDVKMMLSMGLKQQVLDLLGNPTEEISRAMNLMDPKSESYSKNVEGYMYFVPIVIKYDVTTEEFIEEVVYPTGGGIVKTDPTGTDDPVNVTTPGEIEITEDPTPDPDPEDPEKIEVSGDAVLELPDVTYVGHKVHAYDDSIFEIDGVEYSAKHAYAEGLASNSFDSPDCSTVKITRLSSIESQLIFSKTGTYDVVLTVDFGDTVLTDTKTIEVLKAPTITASLAGRQKENRKQTINILIAQNPEYPVEEVDICVADADTGEKISQAFKAVQEGVLVNEAGKIYSRKLQKTSSDEEFAAFTLDFLTKNETVKKYTFEVKCRAADGMTDSCSQEFSVVPDMPPIAAMNLEESYLRTENSDVAEITVSDGSETDDGDYTECRWSVNQGTDAFIDAKQLDGYTDLSFGKGTSICFDQKGVGKFNVSLSVRDVWSDETLSEYISESDYKSDSTVGESEVINIAPVVSVGVSSAIKAKILIITDNQASYDEAVNDTGMYKRALLEKGIYGDFDVAYMSPSASSANSDALTKKITVDSPFGYEGRNTIYESSNFISDERCLYKLEGTWTSSESRYYPTEPYYITAWNISDGSRKWSYSFTNSNFSVNYSSRGSSSYLTYDENGKYLFFVNGSKTMILDRETGHPLKNADFVFGMQNYAGRNGIYTVRDDGLWLMSNDGEFKNLLSCSVIGTGRLVGGTAEFAAWQSGDIYRIMYDLDSGTYDKIKVSNESGWTGSSACKAYIDSADNLLMVKNEGTTTVTVDFYNAENKKIKTFSKTMLSSKNAVTPVKNEKGEIKYVSVTGNGKSAGYYYSDIYLFDMYSDLKLEKTLDDGGNYETVGQRVVFARELNGLVHVTTAADYAYLYNEGYRGYPQRCVDVCFNPKKKSASITRSFVSSSRLDDTVEYGIINDVNAAVQTSDNNKTYGGEHGNITHVVEWKQTFADLTERYYNKYLGANSDADIQAVIYVGSSSPYMSELSKLDDTSAVMKKGNCSFYYLKDDTGNVLNKLSSETGGKQLNLESPSSDLAEDMAERCGIDTGDDRVSEDSEESEEGHITEGVNANAGDVSGSLSRQMSLKSGLKYYYEYDIENSNTDIFNVNYSIQTSDGKEVDNDYLNQKSDYVVSGVEKEDFSDKNINSFYIVDSSRISGGIYSLASAKARHSSYETKFSDSSSISFTIPEGKEAILSFDFKISSPGTAHNYTNYFKIDGDYWDYTQTSPCSGHYTHKSLLKPGKHTIYGYAMWYGAGDIYTKTEMDNLEIEYIQKNSGSLNLEKETQQVSGDDNQYHIRGTFTTPEDTLTYKSMSAAFLSGKPETLGVKKQKEDKYRPYKHICQIPIPQGKKTVFANIKIKGYSTSLSMDDYKRPTTVCWGVFKWLMYPYDITYDSLYLEYITSEITATYPSNLEGSISISSSYTDKYQYNELAKAEYVRMICVDKNDNTLSGRNFTADWDKKIVLYGDAFWSGKANISFEIPQNSNVNIKSLKIYTYIDGEKTYVYNDSMKYGQSLDSSWSISNLTVSDPQNQKKIEEKKYVFKKGEPVMFNVSYMDYEGDPALDGKYYYMYDHEPETDGLNPVAGQILNEPENLFYYSGKYVLSVWAYDDTTRGTAAGGNPLYDRKSNIAKVTFYVESGENDAPWIEKIIVSPGSVTVGDKVDISLFYDDSDKDVLSLETQVILDGNTIAGPVYNTGLTADEEGYYPVITLHDIPADAMGIYHVIARVSDNSGTGTGEHTYLVLPKGEVSGMVYHTDTWNRNRQKYNLTMFDQSFEQESIFETYFENAGSVPRGTNVFWPGEKFMLRAEVEGDARYVDVYIKDNPEYTVRLHDTGEDTEEGKSLFEGELWDESMKEKWGTEFPDQVRFVFTAGFGDGNVRTYTSDVIVDGKDSYFTMHRKF